MGTEAQLEFVRLSETHNCNNKASLIDSLKNAGKIEECVGQP